MFWRRKTGRAMFQPHELAVIDALLEALTPEARDRAEQQIASIHRVQRILDGTEVDTYPQTIGVHDPSVAFGNRRREYTLASVTLSGPLGAGKASVHVVEGHIFSLSFRPGPSKLGRREEILATSVQLHLDPMQPDDGRAAERLLALILPELRAELEAAWEADRHGSTSLLPRDEIYEVGLEDGTWLMLGQLDDTSLVMTRVDPPMRGVRRMEPSGDVIGDYPTLTAALSDVLA